MVISRFAGPRAAEKKAGKIPGRAGGCFLDSANIPATLISLVNEIPSAWRFRWSAGIHW